MCYAPLVSKFFLLSLLVVSADLSASTGGAGEIRIASYNLRNYLVMDRVVDGVWRPSYPKPEVEKEAVRAVILGVRPHILFVQEIGSSEFLEELRADLALFGLHYPYVVHMKGVDDDRHIAFLSMLEPNDIEKHRQLDFKYLGRREEVRRGLLEVSFTRRTGEVFKVFGVHLKSRFTVDQEDVESRLRRTREAEACRNRMIERTIDMGVRKYMVVGDFNASPNSAAMRRFYKRGDLELGSLVPAMDSRGEVWTYFYQKQGAYSQIDGFVVSPELLPFVSDDRGFIVDSEKVMTGSDHRMVYIDLSDRE